jgi:hypothetical protein
MKIFADIGLKTFCLRTFSSLPIAFTSVNLCELLFGEGHKLTAIGTACYGEYFKLRERQRITGKWESNTMRSLIVYALRQ